MSPPGGNGEVQARHFVNSMPNSAIVRLKGIARRLLAEEAASGMRAGASDLPSVRICEQFRLPLEKLLGVGGFRALLSRSLALAGAEVKWLRALHLRADGSLEGLTELEGKLDAHALAEAEIVLAAHVLGLLLTFIGPVLTRQLLHDIWPNADDLNFGNHETL